MAYSDHCSSPPCFQKFAKRRACSGKTKRRSKCFKEYRCSPVLYVCQSCPVLVACKAQSEAHDAQIKALHDPHSPNPPKKTAEQEEIAKLHDRAHRTRDWLQRANALLNKTIPQFVDYALLVDRMRRLLAQEYELLVQYRAGSCGAMPMSGPMILHLARDQHADAEKVACTEKLVAEIKKFIDESREEVP